MILMACSASKPISVDPVVVDGIVGPVTSLIVEVDESLDFEKDVAFKLSLQSVGLSSFRQLTPTTYLLRVNREANTVKGQLSKFPNVKSVRVVSPPPPKERVKKFY